MGVLSAELTLFYALLDQVSHKPDRFIDVLLKSPTGRTIGCYVLHQRCPRGPDHEQGGSKEGGQLCGWVDGLL
jgi:hypothetical protein